MSEQLIGLTVVSTEFEAEEIGGLLEAEGIACLQRHTNQGAAASVGAAWAAPREILVGAADLERARELLGAPDDAAG